MDPISITAGVAGILGGVATVGVKLATLKQRYDQSGLNITLTSSALFSVRRALEAIQRLRSSAAPSEASAQLDADLAVPLESCAVLVAQLERALEGIDVENPTRAERWRFVALNDTFRQAEHSLDAQIRALQLMLTIYQCGTMAEQTERLNRRDTRRLLDQVRQDTQSAVQRMPDTDIAETASILSREPSIRFPFDYEILQTPMYQRVYRDLYLKYKPASSRDSVTGIPSPRASSIAEPTYPPPPPPIPQTQSPSNHVQNPTASNADQETIRADVPPASRPKVQSPQLSQSPRGSQDSITLPTDRIEGSVRSLTERRDGSVKSPTGSAMLNPKSAEGDEHKKIRMTSSLRRPKLVLGPMADLMFLGVPFQGETPISSSESEAEESSDEEPVGDTAREAECLQKPETHEPADSALDQSQAVDLKPQQPGLDFASPHWNDAPEDLYGVSDQESEAHLAGDISAAKPAPTPASPTQEHGGHGGQPVISITGSIPDEPMSGSTNRVSSASLPPPASTIASDLAPLQAANDSERPASSVAGMYLGNAELERLQQAIRLQRSRSHTETAATPSSRSSRESSAAKPRNRSVPEGQREVVDEVDIANRSRSRSRLRDESRADVSLPESTNEEEKEELFSPKLDLPHLGSESSFKIDWAEGSNRTPSPEPTRPATADSVQVAEREGSLPLLSREASLSVKDAVPPPLVVKKSPPPLRRPPPPIPELAPASPRRAPPIPPAAQQSPAIPAPTQVPTAPAATMPTQVPMPAAQLSAPRVPRRPVSSQMVQSPPLEQRVIQLPSPQKVQRANPSSPPKQYTPPAPSSVGISVTSPKSSRPPVPAPRSSRQKSQAPPLPGSPQIGERDELEIKSAPLRPPKIPPPAPPSRAAPQGPMSSPRLSVPIPNSQPQSPDFQTEGLTASPVQQTAIPPSQTQIPSSHSSPQLGAPARHSSSSEPHISMPARQPSRADSLSRQLTSDDASMVSSVLSGSRTSSTFNETASNVSTHHTTIQTNAQTEYSWTGSENIYDSVEQSRQRAIISTLKKEQSKARTDSSGLKNMVRGMSSKNRLSSMFMTNEKTTRIKILHGAAKSGEKSILVEYLKENRNALNRLEKLDEEDAPKTLLMRAAEGDHVECLETLIMHGADFAQTDKEGRIALHHAVQHESVNATRWLAANFHTTQPQSGGKTLVGPLEVADEDGFRALHIAAGLGNESIMRILFEHGAKVNVDDQYGRTPLHTAIIAYKLSAIKMLLEYGANLKQTDSEGKTPLMWAVEANAQKAVELFLERGADRGDKDKQGNTAIHLAARGGCLTIVEMLYLQVSDLEQKNHLGERPLHLAAAADQPRVVKALLRIGCDTHAFTTPSVVRRHAKNATWKDLAASPLHYACANGAYDPAAHLVDHGALVNSNQEDGTSPLMLAAQAKSAPLCGLMLQHGANIEAKTSTEQLTALHVGLLAGDIEVVKLLANNGASTTTLNKKKQTPWQYATKDGNKSTEASKWLTTFTRSQHAIHYKATHPREQIQSPATVGQLPNPQAIPSMPSPPNVGMNPYWGMTATGYVPQQNRFYQPPHIDASQRTEEGVEPPPPYVPR